MFLDRAAVENLRSAIEGALVSYQWLARSANDEGRLQWSIVNKFHFWYHVGEQACFINPRYVWTYMAEDYVGRVSELGAGCLTATKALDVNRKIAERIRLVRWVQLTRSLWLE